MKWSALKAFNKIYVFRLMSAWLVVAPLAAHLTKGLPPKLYLCVEKRSLSGVGAPDILVYSKVLIHSSLPADCGGEIFDINLTLSFNVYLSVLAALIMLFGYLLYQWLVPSVVKAYDDFAEFKAKGGDASMLFGIIRSEINKQIRVLDLRDHTVFRFLLKQQKGVRVGFELAHALPAYAAPIRAIVDRRDREAIIRHANDVGAFSYTLQELCDVQIFLKQNAKPMYDIAAKLNTLIERYSDVAWRLYITLLPHAGAGQTGKELSITFEKEFNDEYIKVLVSSRRIEVLKSKSFAEQLTDKVSSKVMAELGAAGEAVDGAGVLHGIEYLWSAPLLFGEYRFNPNSAAAFEHLFNEVYTIANKDSFAGPWKWSLISCSLLTFGGALLWCYLLLQHLSKLL